MSVQRQTADRELDGSADVTTQVVKQQLGVARTCFVVQHARKEGRHAARAGPANITHTHTAGSTVKHSEPLSEVGEDVPYFKTERRPLLL